MEKFALAGLYVTDIIKFILSYYLLMNCRMKRKWQYLAGILPVLVILFAETRTESLDRLLVGCVVFLCTFVGMQERISSRIFSFLTLLFFGTCVGGVWTVLFNLVGYGPNLTHGEYFLESFLSMTSILFLCLFKQFYLRKKKNHDFLTRNMHYIVLSVSVFIVCVISLLEFARSIIVNERFFLISGVMVLGGYLGAMLLASFVIYTRNANDRLARELEREKEYTVLQGQYYQNLLKQEQETRKLRHDLKNHLFCMAELAKQNEPDKVQGYIESMQTSIREVSKAVVRPSGNTVIDVLTAHYAKELGEQAIIELDGWLDDGPPCTDMQLCTIYGNLIANAVEAQMRLPEEERLLKIRLREGRDYLSILVSNRMEGTLEEDASGHLISKKADQKNHGIGYLNVEKTVEILGGSMERTVEDGVFQVVVILKKTV